jgi:hypothetical protein
MDPPTLLRSRAVFSRREPGDDWCGQRQARRGGLCGRDMVNGLCEHYADFSERALAL